MNLKQFIYEAKKKTYAAGMEEKALEDGSKELVYENGIYKYRDRYFGFDPFAGQEVVFENETPIWVMNYRGSCEEDVLIIKKEIYSFLKKALLHVSKRNPIRGPANFKSKDFEYRHDIAGNYEDFGGYEEIYFRNDFVYHGDIHGGLIREKLQ